MGKHRFALASIAAALGTLVAGAAWAAEPESCRQVRMADPGWTDITATNAFAGVVLNALGYEQKVASLSVPITYVGVKKEQVDVFLGNWMPAQKGLVEPLVKEGAMEVVRTTCPEPSSRWRCLRMCPMPASRPLRILPSTRTNSTKRFTELNPGLPPTRTSRR